MKKKQEVEVQHSVVQSIESANTLVASINAMPEFVFVGRVFEHAWAGVFYESYGVGLACFLSSKDSASWFDTQDIAPIEVVQVSALEAMSIAKRVNLDYIHLLSNEMKNPLGHFSTSAGYM